MMAGPLERYEKLGLRDSLPRIYRYPIACKELSFILRHAYPKLPKNLQSLIFQDTLTAFRLLPEMQTQTANSAVNFLLQSVEAALPKQKRVLAATEFKQAKVAYKRRCKAQREEKGLIQIPQDVLVHIFSFLDLRSLVSAALVCRLWNSASNDDYLWHLQHNIFFGHSDACNSSKVGGMQNGTVLENKEGACSEDDGLTTVNIDWREAFRKAYIGNSSKKFTSYRGYCGRCNTIVWLSGMKCSNKPCAVNSQIQQIKPVSPERIVEYILDGTSSMVSSSDSDSDSEGSTYVLWAHQRYTDQCHK